MLFPSAASSLGSPSSTSAIFRKYESVGVSISLEHMSAFCSCTSVSLLKSLYSNVSNSIAIPVSTASQYFDLALPNSLTKPDSSFTTLVILATPDCELQIFSASLTAFIEVCWMMFSTSGSIVSVLNL